MTAQRKTRRRKRAVLSAPRSEIEDGLNERMIAFVRAYVETGGKGYDAAIAAGYTEGSARSTAFRLIRNPLIQNALYLETRARFASRAPEMQEVIATLALTSRNPRVRLQAAQDWLDRAGFKPVDNVRLQVGGELSVSIDLGGPKLEAVGVSEDPEA